MRILPLALVLAMTASAAVAQSTAPNRLTLKSADNVAERTIVDGATWRCEGATCTATGARGVPAVRACKKVVAKLGPVESFTWGGRDLGAEDLAECNAAAR